MSDESDPNPSVVLWRHIVFSGLRFSAVGILAYSIWAFGLAQPGGAMALYSACAVTFVVLGGFALYPEVRGRIGFLRFCLFFALAFVAFAVVWCVVYFVLKGKHGEVLGFLFGILPMCLILQWGIRRKAALLPAVCVAFSWHIAGYLIGDYLFYSILLPKGMVATGKLAWGFCHGFGFGAGLGWMLQEDAGDSGSQR